MAVVTDVEVHGRPMSVPRRCDEFICEQYWHDGTLTEPSNVLHFRTGDDWCRLTIDFGAVFWRTTRDRPAPYTMPELGAEVRLDDVGARLEVAGHVIVACETTATQNGTQIRLDFSNGRALLIQNIDDRTSVRLVDV